MSVDNMSSRGPRWILRGITSVILGSLGLVVVSAGSWGSYARPGATQQVSVASDGAQAEPECTDITCVNGNEASISADGRYVAFESNARNFAPKTIVPPHTEPKDTIHIYVHDRETRKTVRVSVASDGTEGNFNSAAPAISGDGRYVAFSSSAYNLVPGDDAMPRFSDIFVHDRDADGNGEFDEPDGIKTERVSVASNGSAANGGSFLPAISADGRHVAFSSDATNLVVGDSNGKRDIFVHDREDGETERVSVKTGGAETGGIVKGFNGRDEPPAISADGRFVAFSSAASDLVSDDTNNTQDVFVHDREESKTVRVSVASNGTQGTGIANNFSGTGNYSQFPDISADGRFVSFRSGFYNLVPRDTNDTWDVFVHDRDADADGEFDEPDAISTERVSVASEGSQANDWSAGFSVGENRSPGNQKHAEQPAISGDGRYVVFSSRASNLLGFDGQGKPVDSNSLSDIFVYDRYSKDIELVSVTTEGGQGKGSSDSPTISKCVSAIEGCSGDGRYVAFRSDAWLVNRSDKSVDGFTRDRGLDLGVFGKLTRATVSGGMVIEGKATFPGIELTNRDDDDSAEPLLARDFGADLSSAAILYRPRVADLLVRIGIPSLGSAASCSGTCQRDRTGIVYGFTFKPGEEATHTYEVRVMGSSSTNDPRKAAPYFGLYKCPTGGPCTEIKKLGGAIGSTGDEILVSIPLKIRSNERIQEGDQLFELRVFSGVGDAAIGLGHQLDEIELVDGNEGITVPTVKVQLAVAEPSTPKDEVSYQAEPAGFDNKSGRFFGVIPTTELSPGPYRVWARACLLGARAAEAGFVAESVEVTCAEPTTLDVNVSAKASESDSPTPIPTATPKLIPTPTLSPSENPSTTPRATASPTANPVATPTPTPTHSPAGTAERPPTAANEREVVFKPRPLAYRGVAAGRVKVVDGAHPHCARNVKVRVQFRSSKGKAKWRTIRRVTTNQRGAYRAKPFLKKGRARPGDYRSIAPQHAFTFDGTPFICARAASGVWRLRL